MSVRTFEGVIEKGQVKLNAPVDLPDQTKVYVVVRGSDVKQAAHLHSPRLAQPDQAADFKMKFVE